MIFTAVRRNCKPASAATRDGASKLSAGMQKAVSGNGQLVDGVQSLQSGIGSLRTGLYSFSSSLSSASTGGASTSLDTASLQQQLAALGLTQEQMTAVAGIIQQTAQKASQETASAVIGKVQASLVQLEQGADQLQSGAASLNSGIRQANDSGLVELGKGAADLAQQGGALADGAGSLARGVKKLRDGVGDLNEDGIQKLSDDTSGMRVSLSRRNAVVGLGEEYQSFSGLQQGMTGTVRFVIDTAEITETKPLAATSTSVQSASSAGAGFASGVRRSQTFSKAYGIGLRGFGTGSSACSEADETIFMRRASASYAPLGA